MYIYGKNPVKEAFRARKTVEKIFFLKDEQSLFPLIKCAKEARVIITFADKQTLDKLSGGGNHQGVVAAVTDFEYCDVDDILRYAEERREPALIVLLDGVEDPHNLGAIIRSAECFGAHGVIIPKRRSATVNDTVIKVASGATEFLRVAKVNNLNDAIRYLKQQNVWVYATDFDGKPPKSVNLNDNVAIIIGSEGSGISRLSKQLADGVITIPQFGRVNSLNASVAAGVVLYEASRQRNQL